MNGHHYILSAAAFAPKQTFNTGIAGDIGNGKSGTHPPSLLPVIFIDTTTLKKRRSGASP